ncbi:hypothetical protein BDN67DRAFT_1060772, partial [Paxillus ammoniavirescens]
MHGPCIAIHERLQAIHPAGREDEEAMGSPLQPFEGDFFGDYEEGDLEWPGSPGGHSNTEADAPQNSSNLLVGAEEIDLEQVLDEDEDEQAANDVELEGGWEPERPKPEPEPSSEVDGSINLDSEASGPPARESAATLQHAQTLLGASRRPTVIKFPYGHAGQPIREAVKPFDAYRLKLGPSSGSNIYHPFTSHIDYHFARWAKMRGPGSTAVTELLQIKGVREALGLSYKNTKDLNRIINQQLPSQHPHFHCQEFVVAGETFDLYLRDIMECISALYSDPDFSHHLVFAPERHYVDPDMTKRMFYDLHTGKWWWDKQKELENKEPGATIIPIILSSDKTQITMFHNKAAYLLYMTIGNLPKEIRRKPSRRAWILLAYLPTSRLDHITNQAARCRTVTNLFYACMSHILDPLKAPANTGLLMVSGDGVVRHGHPLIACYAGDYPEQVLVMGTKTGECPKCDIAHLALGGATVPANLRDLDAILAALSLIDVDYAQFTKACKDTGIKPIYKPFWEHLPHVNIFQSITPDILHQLYQGIMKHLISWIKATCGEAEIDARCCRLPPNHNVHIFMKGISSLVRISGAEHNQICRFLLGIIIDIPLPGGLSPARLLCTTRAMLDFLYLSQYPCHTVETLGLLDEALTRFHANKEIFVDLGVRTQFNLPKLHSLRHYMQMIQLFGTTDNYSTEYTERLHIDLAKDAYRATNHKDEYTQMTQWLERREKIMWHDNYVRWRQSGDPQQQEHIPPDLALGVSFDKLIQDYHATFLVEALSRYVVLTKNPELTAAQLECTACDVILPFHTLPVFHKIKFHAIDALGHEDASMTIDAVHCHPSQKDSHGKEVPGQFDMVLVNCGEGGVTGVAGEFAALQYIDGISLTLQALP